MKRAIRVIQVITRLIQGGAQKVCLDICERLSRSKKYEITLVSGPTSGPEGSLVSRAQAIPPLRFKILPSLSREISLLKDLWALISLYVLFSKERPDVVHCHTSKAGFIGCVAARLARVRRIIYSPHGHLFNPQAKIPSVSGNTFRIWLFYQLRKLASLCAHKIIALNESDKQEQVSLRLAPKDKYEVIYNGIDPEKFSITQSNLPIPISLQGHYPILATIGRLSPEKGHCYLIKALKLLKEHYPKVLLLIIGDGDLRGQLEQLTRELDLEKHVYFTGMVDNPFLFLTHIDIFVLPSLYEAFGLVLLEAMLAKKPIVASRVNGVPEIVLDGETGLLVPPGNPEAIAQAISQLTRDKIRAQRMGEVGYQRVVQLFTTSQMVAKFDRLYEYGTAKL